MRRISFFQSADSVTSRHVQGTIAVVADVLRATSTIVTALYHGCEYVVPVKSVQDAQNAADHFDRQDVILGGERNGKNINGFDFGNSPQEYTPASVNGKIVVTTTTNGTKALVHAAEAGMTLVMAFLNLSSVADFILQHDQDVSVVAAGIYGDFSIEDSVCCGLLIDRLLEKSPNSYELDNTARKIRDFSIQYKGNVEKLLHESPHGQFLTKLGYGSDLHVCAQLDAYSIVPIYKNGRITAVNHH
jgi:2-phosphosulfolactate phosphatase